MSQVLPDNTEPFEPHLRRKEAHAQAHTDLMYLAARLLHRGAQTDEESEAASYIFRRFRERTPDVYRDSFQAIDNPMYLFASYYAEFLFVVIIAFWIPAAAAIYGVIIFGCYLAEFLGFNMLSRFLVHYETQNVVARFLAPRPACLFVITAHYDSGFASPLTEDNRTRWLRPAHLVVLASMAVTIATCVAEAYAQYAGMDAVLIPYLRGGALVALLGAAVFLYYASGNTEEVRGANNNASGVCALLRLADELARNPLLEADVWLVATGSNEAWMSGMRQALTSSSLDKSNTYIVNIEAVGAGKLTYTTGEGMILTMPCSPQLVEAARAAATADAGMEEKTLTSVPTATQIALARGFHAIGVIGLDEQGCPPRWNSPADLITGVDREQIIQASEFVEGIIRPLAVKLTKEA